MAPIWVIILLFNDNHGAEWFHVHVTSQEVLADAINEAELTQTGRNLLHLTETRYSAWADFTTVV